MPSDTYIAADPRESSLAGARAWFAERGLTRPRRGKWIAGVGAGFARRYDWNPLVVRLVIIASIMLPGPQGLAYMALWFLMPRDPESATSRNAAPLVRHTRAGGAGLRSLSSGQAIGRGAATGR
jgi:phage shock protein PspC (stress-responsive transcriptional regulator)